LDAEVFDRLHNFGVEVGTVVEDKIVGGGVIGECLPN
jgi:hypothetical protein